MKRIATIIGLALTLVVAACGGGESTTTGDAETDTGTDTGATTDEQSTGSGDFSALLLSGVDTVTANGQLSDLEAAGFEGFVIEGEDETGYTLYRPGLTESEAEELLEAIGAELFPDAGEGFQPGLVVETDVWFSEG